MGFSQEYLGGTFPKVSLWLSRWQNHLQLPSRASGWTATASPQLPEQWEEETLPLPPHPLQQMAPGGSQQLSDICKELLLHPQQELRSWVQLLHGWTTAKVQQSTAQILEIQQGPKAECCWWVWLKVLGWNIHRAPFGASDRLAAASVLLAAAVKATIPFLPSGNSYQRPLFSSSLHVAALLLCLAQYRLGQISGIFK